MMQRPPILHAVLALISVAFAVALYRVVTVRPPDTPTAAAPAESAIAPVADASFAPPAEESFAEISARPLFSASRKPPPPPEPEKTADSLAPPPPPPLALVGVILAGAQKIAVIKESGTGQVRNAVTGDEITGWQLTDITADSITLKNGDVVQDYQLQNSVAPGVTVGGGPRLPGSQ